MGGHKTRYNSLAGDGSAQSIDPIGSTVGNFANRIKRKLKEQEDKELESQRATEKRHARMLQALTTIRKALQEMGQISLGERFTLILDVGDWEGWPRLCLNLVDTLAPEKSDFGLVVTAHDRKQLGVVELRMRSGKLLGYVQLKKQNELERIPLVLKKSVRTFLDDVAEYVLNPEKPSVVTKIESDLIEPEEEIDEFSEKLYKEDLFVEDDYRPSDNSVSAASDEQPLELSAFEKRVNSGNKEDLE